LFGDGVPRDAALTEPLRTWLREFSPQVVYSFLGSMAQIRLTQALVHEAGAPHVIHIMDDWPSVIYTQGLFGPYLRRTVLKEFLELLRTARARLAICEEMCEEYRTRYGHTFQTFHNALDMQEWLRAGRQNWMAGTPFVVRYAGSILSEGQREGLLAVCMAVARLRRTGMNIRISVHAPLGTAQYLKAHCAEELAIEGPPDPRSIQMLLASADLLVLPFNTDAWSAKYLRLSMPTKAPAYMASGTPILVYGPSEIAPVRHAIRYGWADVVTRNDELERAIARLVNAPQERERLAQRARAVAAEQYDAARVRVAFQHVLKEAACGMTN
jgi:glycosyltransferase involved in cell wall biosynthesis